MSKITHEQVEKVFEKIVWLTNRLANWNGDDLEYLEREYNYLTNSQVVWNFLKQQEKREKLLELYKELATLYRDRFDYTNSATEIKRLWGKIKEEKNDSKRNV